MFSNPSKSKKKSSPQIGTKLDPDLIEDKKRKKGFHHNLVRVYALLVVQPDSVFPPQEVTPEVRGFSGAPNSDRGPQFSTPAVQFLANSSI